MSENAQKMDSLLLRRVATYEVLLPVAYNSSKFHYPILYLLHGLFGQPENWLELTNIRELARSLDLIIVMPDGSDGWYCDSATDDSARYESFLCDEFIPAIELKYRTTGERSGRAIAGLSMGGYGAFKLAVKRPELFVFACSFSGPFDICGRSDDAPGFDWETMRPSVLKAFGEGNTTTRMENDLDQIFRAMPSQMISDLPFLYFDCGLSDGFLEANLRLDRLLQNRGVAHEFKLLEGGHDWQYWGSRLPMLFNLAIEKLSRPRFR